MFKHLNLPPSLEVRKGTGSVRFIGLFAKERIRRGTRLFSREIHTTGISGYTLNDVRSICHHCLEAIGTNYNTLPIVCRKCRIIGYCSNKCLKAAHPLHSLECKGITELEKLRGKVILKIPRPSSWSDDYERHWPPPHALLAAHVINKGIIKEDQDASNWIEYVTTPETLPPVKASVFSQLEEYVRLLVPEEVSSQEIKRALQVISINASTMGGCPPGTMIIAVYNNAYCLLNHMCKPNCEIDREKDGTVAVYTIDDVKAGEQLGISFVMREYYMNVREVRRAKLNECFGLDCKCFVCQKEAVPGSKLWLLEQQKLSLIAPWSRAMARQTMVRGWGLLCDGNSPSLVNSPFKIAEILEPAIKSQKLILDQHNVILLLTATTLLLMYCRMDESEMAIDTYYRYLGPVGLAMLKEYGTRRDVADITGNICIRFFDLERMVEFNDMFKLTQQMHPRRPSHKALCDMLQLTPENPQDVLSAEDLEIDKDELIRECHARADRLGIPREFYEEFALEFFEEHEQFSMPDLIQAAQELYDEQQQY